MDKASHSAHLHPQHQYFQKAIENYSVSVKLISPINIINLTLPPISDNTDATDKNNLLAILKLAETICKTYQTFGNESVDYEFERIKENLFFYLDISSYEFEEIKAEVLYRSIGTLLLKCR